MHEYFPSPWLDSHYPYNHPDHCHDDCHHAPECDDQLPVFSTVGRGIKGDSYRVDIVDPDTHEITQLEGKYFDEATQTWTTEWLSENINGGHLEYQYHLRPYNVPATFTITFKYHRPSAHGWILDEDGNKVPTSRTHNDSNTFCGDGKPNDSRDESGNKIENNVGDDPTNECSWVWTTPPIPYFWTPVNADGSIDNPPDHIVGSGCSTLFTRTMHDESGNPLNDNPGNWDEQLLYPHGWTREHFNAPTVLQPWTVNLRFGHGGDVFVPDFYDISKIIGVPIQNIVNLLNDQDGQIDGSDNVVDYIKDWVKHIHDDMGFGGPGFGGNLISDDPSAKIPGTTNQPATIKNYIAAAKTEVTAGTLLTVTSTVSSTDGHTTYNINDTALQNAISDVSSSIPEEFDPTALWKAINDIVNHMPGVTINATTGAVTFPAGHNVAIGDINLYGGTTEDYGIIRTHEGAAGAGGAHDVWAQ